MLERISMVPEEDLHNQYGELRQAAMQFLDVNLSTQRKSEPRILPPQKPVRKLKKCPIYPLEKSLWVRRHRVARVYPIHVQNDPQRTNASIDYFSDEIEQIRVHATEKVYQRRRANVVQHP